jgi:hypothetical protein
MPADLTPDDFADARPRNHVKIVLAHTSIR